MLTEREVLSTINMLRSEHLDVRTLSLIHISEPTRP